MDIAPLIIPITNVSVLPLELRRDMDTKGLDLKNVFSLAELVEGLEQVLYFGFLIKGLSASNLLDLVKPTALRYIIVNRCPATSETVERFDIIISGTAVDFKDFDPEITKYLNQYKGVVWKSK